MRYYESGHSTGAKRNQVRRRREWRYDRGMGAQAITPRIRQRREREQERRQISLVGRGAEPTRTKTRRLQARAFGRRSCPSLGWVDDLVVPSWRACPLASRPRGCTIVSPRDRSGARGRKAVNTRMEPPR